MGFQLPSAQSVAVNPTQPEMREWVLEHMPNITVTEFDNINYKAEVKARLAASTFFITERRTTRTACRGPSTTSGLRKQDAYIADKDMILIEGYIGPDPTSRRDPPVHGADPGEHPCDAAAALLPEGRQLGAGVHRHLHTRSQRSGKPMDRLILVDHDNYVTRVFGSDYFGESKMGGLRMWNHLVYRAGRPCAALRSQDVPRRRR